MIPPREDPRWRKFVLSDDGFDFDELVTQLMYSRICLVLQADKSEAAVQAAISLAHEYFHKNEKIAFNDLKKALGEI